MEKNNAITLSIFVVFFFSLLFVCARKPYFSPENFSGVRTIQRYVVWYTFTMSWILWHWLSCQNRNKLFYGYGSYLYLPPTRGINRGFDDFCGQAISTLISTRVKTILLYKHICFVEMSFRFVEWHELTFLVPSFSSESIIYFIEKYTHVHCTYTMGQCLKYHHFKIMSAHEIRF